MARRRKPRPDRQQPSTTEVASTNSAPTKFSSFAIVLASICGLAFFLRCMNVMQTIQVPTLIELLGDARGYFEWAVRISDGDWYGTETFYQAPLYPYFLAVLIKVFGPSITAIRLVQMMLGVAGVALIGLAGRKLFSERIGLVSALMLAVYPPAIYYDGIIQKAAVATFLLSAFLAACVYLQCEKRWWYAVLTGATLGLLVLARENALLWTPLVPFWILLGMGETKLHRWKSHRLLCRRPCPDLVARRRAERFTRRGVVANHVSSWPEFLHRQQPASQRNLHTSDSWPRYADV